MEMVVLSLLSELNCISVNFADVNLSKILSALGALIKAYDEIADNRSSLKSINNELNCEVAFLKAKLDSEKESRINYLNDSFKTLDISQAEIEVLQGAVHSLNDNLKLSQLKSKNLEAENLSLSERIDDLDSQVSALKTKTDELTSCRDGLVNSLNNLRSKSNDWDKRRWLDDVTVGHSLNAATNDEYVVTAMIKPGGKLEDVIDGNTHVVKTLTNNDYAVVMAGTNNIPDCCDNLLDSFEYLMNNLSHTNAVILGIPKRYNNTSVNPLISETNRKLKTLVDSHRHATFISLEGVPRRCYAGRGLHFNMAGKRLIVDLVLGALGPRGAVSRGALLSTKPVVHKRNHLNSSSNSMDKRFMTRTWYNSNLKRDGKLRVSGASKPFYSGSSSSNDLKPNLSKPRSAAIRW
ncbi:hypothetical protein J6590_060949 [Homalodisca vitripennis]|nr:hypothetical protein J6590_060949 [Homalodisca vitripennis]